MIAKLRNLWVGLVFGLIAYVGCSPWAAFAQEADNQPLQIHGMTLDETRLGDGFCEKGMAETVRPQCAQTRQLLPKVASIDVRTLPAPYVALTLAAEPEEVPEVVQLWYAPRELGGQGFLITTTTFSPFNLDVARKAVVTSFGAPTVEFTHADMEARGIHVNDLMVDTLIYVDRHPADYAMGCDRASIEDGVRSDGRGLVLAHRHPVAHAGKVAGQGFSRRHCRRSRIRF